MILELIINHFEKYLKFRCKEYVDRVLRIFPITVTDAYPEDALLSIETTSKNYDSFLYFIIVKEDKKYCLRYIEYLDMETYDSELFNVDEIVNGCLLLDGDVIELDLNELLFVDGCVEDYNENFLKPLS